MKTTKSLIKIIAFSLAFCLLLFVLSYLAKPFSYNLQNVQGLYSLDKNSIDAVYIGGSAAFVYYAPLKAWDDYGIVSYVYGNDTLQAELYVTMIKEVLKTQTPELIILDARAFQYRDKDNIDAQPPGEVPYRNTLTGMRLSRNKVEFIKQHVGTHIDDNKLAYYFDLIKYHDNIINYSSANLEMLFGKYRNPYNGFHFVPKVQVIEQYNPSTTEKKEVSKETEAILNDLLDYLDTIEAECLFVVSPYAEKQEHKMIYNYVQEIIENRGFDFLDCNEHTTEMSLDYSTDFYNANHANIYGAEKYTDFLNKYILQNYSIPNRKNDPNYSFMNDYLQEWYEAVINTKSEINMLMKEQTDE